MRCWTPRAEGGAGTSRAGPGEEGRSALAREGSACEDSAREVPAPPSARGVQQRIPSLPFLFFEKFSF